MQRTISILLDTDQEAKKQLSELQDAYHSACNQIVPEMIASRCWNRVALHRLVYTKMRSVSPLGSQMVCNAIFSVCKAYKAKAILPKEEVPKIVFHKGKSVHFKCSCGNQQHADCNASQNLCRFGLVNIKLPNVTCAVNRTQVAVKY